MSQMGRVMSNIEACDYETVLDVCLLKIYA